MKREVLQFVVRKPKVRAHRALFDDELPFKHRVERRRDVYERRPKHRDRVQHWE